MSSGQHVVARGPKILIYCRVNSGFTPGVLPSAPAGPANAVQNYVLGSVNDTSLYHSCPRRFCHPSCRVLPSLVTFCINLLTLHFGSG